MAPVAYAVIGAKALMFTCAGNSRLQAYACGTYSTPFDIT